jgi:uncharacterized FlgJ-related protein
VAADLRKRRAQLLRHNTRIVAFYTLRKLPNYRAYSKVYKNLMRTNSA